MRIVGGEWKGRPLEAPEGRDVTRPTTDRTREQMASMVLSAFGLDLSEVSVLDAFAGSGAIGFELLSRGAAHCTFVDADRKASARIRRNADKLKAPKTCFDVVCADAMHLSARASVPGAPFALVVLDPPYAMEAEQVTSLVDGLIEAGQLTSDALVLYEHATHSDTITPKGAVVLKSKSHGTTAVELLRIGEPDDHDE